MIPDSINDVTADWLAEAVCAPVIGFELTQIGQGVGIMGDIFKVGLQYAGEDAGPASVVVKLPSSFPENREQGVALGMFDAEVKFYNELAGQVPTGLPHIYQTAIESGTAKFVIVMEDLSDMILVDQHVGLTIEQARAAVGVLAEIHAVWWDKAQTSELEWIPTQVGPRIEFVDTLLVDLLEPFSAKFQDYLPAGGLDVFRAFAGNYLNVTKTIAGRSPWTLVHQDFRVENLLFAADDSNKVVVLDWQGIGRGPGAYDLAYLLGGSMEPELRRAHESELLDRYADGLASAGITGYSRDALADDYALAHFMGGLATSMVVGGGMDLSNDRGMQLCVTMATRHVTAALDHGGAQRLHDIAAAQAGG